MVKINRPFIGVDHRHILGSGINEESRLLDSIATHLSQDETVKTTLKHQAEAQGRSKNCRWMIHRLGLDNTLILISPLGLMELPVPLNQGKKVADILGGLKQLIQEKVTQLISANDYQPNTPNKTQFHYSGPLRIKPRRQQTDPDQPPPYIDEADRGKPNPFSPDEIAEAFEETENKRSEEAQNTRREELKIYYKDLPEGEQEEAIEEALAYRERLDIMQHLISKARFGPNDADVRKHQRLERLFEQKWRPILQKEKLEDKIDAVRVSRRTDQDPHVAKAILKGADGKELQLVHTQDPGQKLKTWFNEAMQQFIEQAKTLTS